MKRLTANRDSVRAIVLEMFCVLAFVCAPGDLAFAQHAGGHLGGGIHAPAPATSHVLIPRPVIPVGAISVGQRLNSPILFAGSLRLPIRPFRPAFPVSAPFTFRPPLFGFFGFGFGFNSGLWPNCDPFLSLEYACGGLPVYGFGPGYQGLFYNPGILEPPIETQIWPIYIYGGGDLGFVQLYLKDGTMYNVTDYWLVNGQLYFTTLEENGTKLVEHVIDFDLLDLQRTVDVDTLRGFRFVLRDEPIEQYLQDHLPGSPGGELPEAAPPEPSQTPAPPGQSP